MSPLRTICAILPAHFVGFRDVILLLNLNEVEEMEICVAAHIEIVFFSANLLAASVSENPVEKVAQPFALTAENYGCASRFGQFLFILAESRHGKLERFHSVCVCEIKFRLEIIVLENDVFVSAHWLKSSSHHASASAKVFAEMSNVPLTAVPTAFSVPV